MSGEGLLLIGGILLLITIVRPDIGLQILGIGLILSLPLAGLAPVSALAAGLGSGFAIGAGILFIALGRALHYGRTLVLLKRASDPAAAAAVPAKRLGF